MANTDPIYDNNAVNRSGVASRRVVHAMFPDPDAASRALGALLDQGVQANDVSVMIKDLPPSWKHMTTSNEVMDHASDGITVTTAGDAAAGALKGTGIGLGIGALAALATIAIPGVGIVLGGGVLASALGATVATGVAGAMAGAVLGYLKDQGVDETTAFAVENDYELGGALVSVSTPSGNVTADEIEHILAKYKDHWYGILDRENANRQEVPSDTVATNPYPR